MTETATASKVDNSKELRHKTEKLRHALRQNKFHVEKKDNKKLSVISLVHQQPANFTVQDFAEKVQLMQNTVEILRRDEEIRQVIDPIYKDYMDAAKPLKSIFTPQHNDEVNLIVGQYAVKAAKTDPVVGSKVEKMIKSVSPEVDPTSYFRAPSLKNYVQNAWTMYQAKSDEAALSAEAQEKSLYHFRRDRDNPFGIN